MNFKETAAVLAAVVAAAVISAAPACATDNIRTFGEEETLLGPNHMPYIGYTVSKLAPSKDPVPHNGKLYSAKLVIDGYGGNTDPMIGRFGARAQSGQYYPSIPGASNGSILYFDVVGVEPNSVVWNDGIRDILAWIPGKLPVAPPKAKPVPPDEAAGQVQAPPPPPPPAPPADAGAMPADAGPMPVETDPAIVATPDVIAPPPFELSEAEVASPGFNAR